MVSPGRRAARRGNLPGDVHAPAPRRLPLVWLLLVAVAVAGLVTARVVDLDRWRVAEGSAGLLFVLSVYGLTARAGTRFVGPTLLSLVLAAAAVGFPEPMLRAGLGTASAVVGAVLAVLLTTPASRYQLAVREVLVATVAAACAALGTAGWDADLGIVRFSYVVLGGALVLGVMVVYRLGAGLQGIGRRGYVLLVAAAVLLVVMLAYSEAVAHWGAPGLVDRIDEFRTRVRVDLHAVPHPIEAIFGIPALTWGAFMRARRRQGWWVCVFGVAATASMATHLVERDVALGTTLLSEAYSLVVGLVLGYIVIRADLAFTGSHGRRARRAEEAGAHRPEPRRLQALT